LLRRVYAIGGIESSAIRRKSAMFCAF